MIGALLVGLFAAVWVSGAFYLQSQTTEVIPLVILGIAAVASLFQRFLIDRHPVGRVYEGLPDLLVHIHTPSMSDMPWRWTIRGAVSFLFAVFGGLVGAEGAAIEFSYAVLIKIRARSARWFEQRRRTDTACALAAGISAAFGAPFAGMLLPMELGIGGRTLHSAAAALAAFVGMKYLAGFFPVQGFDLTGTLYGFSLGDWREWMAAGVIAIASGALGAGIVRFIGYCRESLFHLYRARGWMRLLAGGVLLYLIAILHRNGYAAPRMLLENVLWSRTSVEQGALLLFVKFLTLAVLLSTFGTIGIFWPLFAMGGFFGFILNQWVFHDLPGFTAAAGIIGASALWGAVLGTPLAAAVLCFEMTHMLPLVLPCFLAGLIAREIARLLKGRTLVDVGLQARGLKIIEGRSRSVLESIPVKDAMVVDYQTILEHEAVSDLQDRLVKSRYPFLPVIRREGGYCGMLTLDMIQEAWHTDHTVTSHSSLSKLLEVKDLLYRSGFKTPTVDSEQRLSEVTALLEHYPCLPVVDSKQAVIGLLLVQNVRQAYDREVVRRSLELASLNAL